MTTVNILSGGAPQGLVRGLGNAFKAQTGFDIDGAFGAFGAVGVMADKLRASTPADLVILTQALLAKLAAEKWKPDLREVLRSADAIYVPDTQASTAGQHVAKLLDQLGISYEVTSRVKIFPNGATAMRELAACTATRPIGCTQATEIIATAGVVLSGSLPPGCELVTMYSAGIAMQAAHPKQAAALIALLTGADQRELRQRVGFAG